MVFVYGFISIVFFYTIVNFVRIVWSQVSLILFGILYIYTKNWIFETHFLKFENCIKYIKLEIY